MAKTRNNFLELFCAFTLIYIRNVWCYQMNCSNGYFMASSNLCLPFDARCSQNQLYFNSNCHTITQGLCLSDEMSINNRCCSIHCVTNCLKSQSCSCCNTLDIHGNICNQPFKMNMCPPSLQPCSLINGQPCVSTYLNSYPCPLYMSYGLPCQNPQTIFQTPPVTRPPYPIDTSQTFHPTSTTYPTYSIYPTPPPTYLTHPTYPSYSTYSTQPTHSTYPTHPSHVIRPTPPVDSTVTPHLTPGSNDYNCTNGTIYMNGKCHPVYCPFGTIFKSDRCIIAQCPDGTIWNNGRCVLPKPIERNIIINNTITNQFNGSVPKSDIVINTYNNLNINSTINLDLNGDVTPILMQTSPSSLLSSTISVTTVTPVTDATENKTDKCCSVLSPRICKPKARYGHWICTSRRQRVCGEFCIAPTIILIPPHVKQHHLNTTSKPIVVMPPEPACGTLCPSVKHYYDCSGCGIGQMEFCSSYCYHYDCPIQSCRFYEQQTYCAQYIEKFGCQFEDGCYDDWCTTE